jgi:hypothetical protein
MRCEKENGFVCVSHYKQMQLHLNWRMNVVRTRNPIIKRDKSVNSEPNQKMRSIQRENKEKCI